jgi:N-acetylglucosaminyldiphosphoundecaprenol N-acetyl-beta-D-mannosaminyltransferase
VIVRSFFTGMSASIRQSAASPGATVPAEDRPKPRYRLRFGWVWVDVLTSAEALDEIDRLVTSRKGGAVFTPNVDHVVKAELNPAFRAAYQHASLSLADGMPLVWVSRLIGRALPERVAGSDLIVPLLRRAATRGWRVYLLGGAAGVAPAAAEMLARDLGVVVAGWDDAQIGPDGLDRTGDSVARAKAAQPDLILVALGPPKQELWIARSLSGVGPAVGVGVGASLDFLVGKYRRAPEWLGRIGLEWLYRLLQEPRRLWRRYLVEGPRFLGVVWRTLRLPAAERVRTISPPSSRDREH